MLMRKGRCCRGGLSWSGVLLFVCKDGLRALSVPAEGPCGTSECHEEQEDGCKEAKGDMAVVGKAVEAFVGLDGEATTELCFATRPPQDKPC